MGNMKCWGCKKVVFVGMLDDKYICHNQECLATWKVDGSCKYPFDKSKPTVRIRRAGRISVGIRQTVENHEGGPQ